MRWSIAIVLIALAALPSVAGAATRAEPSTRELRRQAAELYQRSAQRVSERIEACRYGFDPKRPEVIDGEPSAELKSVLGILRRPSTDAERARLDGPSPRVIVSPGTVGLYRDGLREVTSASGVRFVISTAAGVKPFGPSPRDFDRCQRAIGREAERRLEGRPARLGRFVRALLRRARRERPDPTPAKLPEGLFVGVEDGEGFGGGGGAFDLDGFVRRGLFSSKGDLDSRARLDGLVPDGVATVTVQYPREANRGRGRKPKVYPSAHEQTAPVKDNVVSLEVPRGAGDALGGRMTWRDAAGGVVRVVPAD